MNRDDIFYDKLGVMRLVWIYVGLLIFALLVALPFIIISYA